MEDFLWRKLRIKLHFWVFLFLKKCCLKKYPICEVENTLPAWQYQQQGGEGSQQSLSKCWNHLERKMLIRFSISDCETTTWHTNTQTQTHRHCTSADSLLFSRQNSRCVDDADALKDLIGHLRADEPADRESCWTALQLTCSTDTFVVTQMSKSWTFISHKTILKMQMFLFLYQQCKCILCRGHF